MPGSEIVSGPAGIHYILAFDHGSVSAGRKLKSGCGQPCNLQLAALNLQPVTNWRLMLHYKLVPVLAFSIDPSVFWPYAAGAAILAVGLPIVMLGHVRRAHGLDKLTAFGPLLFAVAMAVFGADHFVSAKFVASIVPSFIPWHLFWAYFVGVALIAGALSFATTILWRLAAGSFALMFLIFELTMHIPNLIAVPHSKPRLILLLRDIPFLAAGLAFAASRMRVAATPGAPRTAESEMRGTESEIPGTDPKMPGALLSNSARKRLVTVACALMAIPIGFFGIEHFLNPHFAPGIPQDDPRLTIPMPNWLPMHLFWIYLTGSIFVISAIALITLRYARPAALLIGATVLLMVALVYIPVTIARAGDVNNGLNYVCIHFALAGAALMLAGSLPSHSAASAGAPEKEPALDQVATSSS